LCSRGCAHRRVCCMQLARYHELRVQVELRSSELRAKLQALDVIQRTTGDQLDAEAKKLNEPQAKAERLLKDKERIDERLLEADKKIRSVLCSLICRFM